MGENIHQHVMKTIQNTVSLTADGLTILVTQEYRVRFNTGHYKYSITNDDGDIVGVGQSVAGAPKGKMGINDAIRLLDDYLHQLSFK